MSYQFNIPYFKDNDGLLGVFEFLSILNFDAKRLFFISDVPVVKIRANHACMNAANVFIAISGKVSLSIEFGGEINEFSLTTREQAVYATPGSWIKAYGFSEQAVFTLMTMKSTRIW